MRQKAGCLVTYLSPLIHEWIGLLRYLLRVQLRVLLLHLLSEQMALVFKGGFVLIGNVDLREIRDSLGEFEVRTLLVGCLSFPFTHLGFG